MEENEKKQETPLVPQKITFEQLMLMAPAFIPPAVMPMLKQMEPVLKKKFDELATYPGRIVQMEKDIADLKKLIVELASDKSTLINFETRN